ncbi:MFS transporter [Escherichia coli]|nr:MFS transporter [Escherichia coli]
MLTKKKWALFSLLTLCGGTIYKLPSLKDAFYIPMQEYFHLTNGQIGNAMSVNSFVTTVGFFLSIYFADKLPRRYTMSFSLIATGLLGVYLTTMPGYWGILFVWALFGVTCDMMNWPVLLKSVSRLGNSEQQGRLFGFFETGRGIVDTVVAFSALAVFTWFGSGLLGFKAGIWFYSLIVIAVGIIIFFVLNDKEEAPSVEVKKEDGASQNTSMTSVLRDKTIWLIAFNVFFVYAVYCGLTFFIPFLKSPSKYLCYTFIISTAALVLLIMLPHESMPVYLGMACTLGFGAIVFTQRAVFFAPIGEAKIAENKTGAAMALGSFIGYAPAMFCFSLYGYILDLNPGIIGYKIVFGIMACFAFCGAVVSVMLVKRISQRKKEMLAAEA